MKNPVPTEIEAIVRKVFSNSELNLDETTASVIQVREILTGQGAYLDRLLVEQIISHRQGLREAQEQIHHCRELMEHLTAPPLHQAVFQKKLAAGDGAKAIVQIGNQRRAVVAAEGVDLDKLARGAEVYMNEEQNLVVLAASDGTPSAVRRQHSSASFPMGGWFCAGMMT